MAWSAQGAPAFFRLWGLMFVSIGIYITIGRYFWEAYLPSRLTYAVCENGSAYIVGPGGKTQGIYLPSLSNIRLQDNGDGVGTILFGDGPLSTGRFTTYRGTRPLAFEFVRDASKVFDIWTQFQRR